MLFVLRYTLEDGDADEFEGAVGLKSPLLSRAAERGGKVPGKRAPPVGTILFPSLAILASVACFSSGAKTSPDTFASMIDPNCRAPTVATNRQSNCSDQPIV